MNSEYQRVKKTHWIKIVNMGTPGRLRFGIDGIAGAVDKLALLSRGPNEAERQCDWCSTTTFLLTP